MRLFYCPITAISYNAAQDIGEINCGSAKLSRLMNIDWGQGTEVGDAQDEQIMFDIILGYTTSGSGGGTITPEPLDPGDTAFAGTVERNNTTVASGGTPATKYSSVWNVRAGGIWYPPDPIIIPPSGRLVIRVPAPADAMTLNMSFKIGEEG